MRCATTTRTRSGSCTGPPRWVTVRFRRLGRWSAGELVDPLGQRDIEVGETVAIVRRQGNVDAVVDVEPFRVMVQLLRRHRDPRHEAPGLAERLELESRSEEHTSELQSLMRISYAVFCLKKKNIMTRHSGQHNKTNST